MDIHIHFDPPKPKKPTDTGITPEMARKIFKNNEEFLESLLKMGYNEEEAAKLVLLHGKADGKT